MNINRNEPSKRTNGIQSVWSKLYATATLPMPVRLEASPKPRWLQVTLHAFAIVFAAIVVAPLLTLLMGFLEPVAFPTAVIICCYPIYIWMYYCGVDGVRRDSVLYPAGLAFSLILSFAAVDGLAATPKVLLSLAFLMPVLAAEWTIGKVLLATQACDHAMRSRDPNVTQQRHEP